MDKLPDHSRQLDEAICKESDMSSLHQEIALGILDLQKSVGSKYATSRVVLNTEGAHLLFVVPSNKECASICLYLYVNPPPTTGTIGLSAGQGTYVNIPEDVYPPLKGSTSNIVVKAVAAIMDGYLEETQYCAGARPYKHMFRLNTNIGEISITRMRPMMSLCKLFRKCTSARVVFPSYTES